MFRRIKNIANSDNSQVLLGNLSASFFGLITFMLLARSLTLNTFGEWAVFVAASGFADLLRTGLIRQAMVRFVSLTNADSRKIHYQRAATTLHLLTILVISMVLWTVLLTIGEQFPSPYDLFLTWYPLWMILSLPHMMDTWFAHALHNYRRMNRIRLIINIGFLGFVLIGFFVEYNVRSLILGNMLMQGVVSASSLLRYPAVFFKLNRTSSRYMVQLFRFGKHSLATLTGANLLKSADHMIIGGLMGTEAVAIYAIPLKLMDLIEIPLRGFVMTSFPKLSVFAIRRDLKGFELHFYQWTGLLTLLVIPVGLVILVFPQWFIQILGGSAYLDSQILLQIFVIAMVLMPIDKYMGMSFDSINAPKRNAIKVWVMVIINVVGDYLAITYLDSLTAVAAVTVLTISSGVIAGFMMHPILRFDGFKMISIGIKFGWQQIRQLKTPIVDKTLPSAE